MPIRYPVGLGDRVKRAVTVVYADFDRSFAEFLIIFTVTGV